MKPAIIVIDVQNEYFAPHGKWVLPEGEPALARINALLAAARAQQTPILHMRHEELGATEGVFVPGSLGADLYPGLEVRPEEPQIVKHFPGSFTQTPLESYLRQAQADTVVICGYMTQMCCDTTTRQASERDYHILFAADGTAARALKLNGRPISHQQVQETTLANMTQFADVLSVDQIIERLQTKTE
jgi:nicotinamidase-related amidase